jgi:CRISPR/Cas system-associated exonuclease Cas4 (RecB family)
MAVEVYFVPSRDDAVVEQKLSVSKVKTFDSCKAKFKFSYIEKLPKKEWDFHIFGTFMHDTLEHFHLKMIDNTKDATIPEGENPDAIQEDMWPSLMKEAFMDSCDKYKDKLSTEQKNESFVILQDYLDLMREQKKNGTLSHVTEAERSFYIVINEKVLLNGFIDRIQVDHDGVLHVADYKTTKNKKYLQDFFQLETYAYALFLAYPDLDRVRASFVCLRHNFDYITKDFNRKDVEYIGQKFIDYAESIDEEKLWRPQPQFLCKYCDFLEKCHQGERFLVKRGIIDDTEINKSFGLGSW